VRYNFFFVCGAAFAMFSRDTPVNRAEIAPADGGMEFSDRRMGWDSILSNYIGGMN
jgi:hypothetical protein